MCSTSTWNIITRSAIIRARAIPCSFRRPDQKAKPTVRFSVVNGLGGCSNTTNEGPHEFFDHTGYCTRFSCWSNDPQTGGTRPDVLSSFDLPAPLDAECWRGSSAWFGCGFGLNRHGASQLHGIGTLLQPHDQPVLQGPHVCETRGEPLAGPSGTPRIAAESDDVVA